MNALEWPEGKGDGERVVVHTKRALGFSMTATNVPRGRKRVYLYTKNCVCTRLAACTSISSILYEFNSSLMR